MEPFPRLALSPPFPPMEAKLVEVLPDQGHWQFEPKWDGFRCLVFRDGDEVELQSKASRPLGRYFPEIVEAVRKVPADRFILDGELIIPIDGRLSFDALQLRLHPAESRIRKLAGQTPARLMLFDCLQLGGRPLAGEPLSERRAALEDWHRQAARADLKLSPFTHDPAKAQKWLERAGGALDGVIAKPLALPYRSGERAMLKVKRLRSADCVVGGFRYASKGGGVGSLLLGLHGEDGLLHHVGFTSALPPGEKETLKARLEALIEAPGFTGRAPGGPSRWSTERSADWQPLRPRLVAEVRYDHVTGDRFRHGTKFLRWRPDKDPSQCRLDQLQAEQAPEEMQAELGMDDFR